MRKMENCQTLHPVILPVSEKIAALSGRKKQSELSSHARKALFLSARISDVILGDLRKGERGNPLPSNGIYWSVSHTFDYVAAVAAPFPVGVDIEQIKRFTPSLKMRVAAPEEWQLAEKIDELLYCRFWTAKEAILKVVGEGLRGLSKCSISEIVDEAHLNVTFGADSWTVSHFFNVPGHIASISVPQDKAQWHLSPVDAAIQ